MPAKPLSSYFVALATDASEVERFRFGGDVARASMRAAGLNDPKLQDTLLDGNQPAIESAITDELANVPGGPHATSLALHVVSTIARQHDAAA